MASAEKIVIRPILPRRPNLFAEFSEEVAKQVALTLTGPVAKTLTNAEQGFMSGWEHAPNIVAEFTAQKTQLKLWVGPKGINKRYWVFVSLGAKGKSYGPKNASSLSVRLGYDPKTRVGGGSGSGYYRGPFIRAPKVDWPGIKPRHFEEQIVKKHGNPIVLQVGKTVEKVLRQYG